MDFELDELGQFSSETKKNNPRNEWLDETDKYFGMVSDFFANIRDRK